MNTKFKKKMKVVNRITGENPINMEEVITDWVKRGKTFKITQLMKNELADLRLVGDNYEVSAGFLEHCVTCGRELRWNSKTKTWVECPFCKEQTRKSRYEKEANSPDR